MQMQFSMRKHTHWSAALLAMLIAFAPPASAQNRGKDKDGDKDHDKHGKIDDRRRKNDDKGDRGKSKSAKLDRSNKKDDRAHNRDFARSNRAEERVAAGALARGMKRGLRNGDVVITTSGNRVHLVNRSGILLVDLDDAHARNLGAWRVKPLDGQAKANAPSFCRSGAGHPVWGRQWCLDKGYGLANTRESRWGVMRDVNDIDMRHVDGSSLPRAVLIDVLGSVVFNRLGLHAVTLGYTDPLVGTWMGDGSGARVLRITSGETPIAEIIDADRDNRADNLIVALRPW